jgi:hypothetical protein
MGHQSEFLHQVEPVFIIRESCNGRLKLQTYIPLPQGGHANFHMGGSFEGRALMPGRSSMTIAQQGTCRHRPAVTTYIHEQMIS